MAEQNQNQRPLPRNIFEQIAQGLEITNQNVVDTSAAVSGIFQMVREIHAALYPAQAETSEPTAVGPEKE